MSDSVGVVRRVYDALNRADFDAATESFSQTFEFDFSNSRGPLTGIYRGPDGAREFLSAFYEPWASLTFDLQEVVELEDGHVLAEVAVRARGDESGVDVAAVGATVWTIHDGEVVAVTGYQSKDEALDATGS